MKFKPYDSYDPKEAQATLTQLIDDYTDAREQAKKDWRKKVTQDAPVKNGMRTFHVSDEDLLEFALLKLLDHCGYSNLDIVEKKRTHYSIDHGKGFLVTVKEIS